MMRILITLVIFTSACLPINAQNYDFPPRAEPGKCYEKCFDYDKKFKWKEVDCETIKAKRNKKLTQKELVEVEQKKT